MLKNDLKNDIEKTLQAHCPEPPEGFAERMDNKAISLMQKKHNQNVNKGRSRYRLPVLVAAAVLVLCFVTAASRDLIIRPDAIRAQETATPLVTALSEGHGEATEGEGLSQEAIEALEVNFPGVADKLKPVNLSCEKQGIRMNVISALVEDDKSWVVYSLQDLEGDRISRFAGMDVDLLGFVGDIPGYYCYLDHNQEEHKVTCVHYEEYGEPYQPVDNHFAFKVEDIGKNQITKIDLLPFLEKYGKTSDGVKMPDEAFVFGNKGQIYSTANMKVLDDSDQLNVSLYKDIYLTGIGWIDDQLHVRIQDRQQEKITIGSMSVYPVFLSAAGYFSETGKQCEMDQVEWSSAGDERKDLKEYIFDVRPDEVDKMELAAWADDTVDVTRDVWEVQIPADSILAETENPAATVNAVVENESDEQIKATLWAFFTDWVGQNTNYMLLVCADEWKERQSDPEQAARELMASRKPDGYIINSISGKDNDPVRTVDLTVQWDAGTYSRHEIPFKLQQVTPQMDAYRVDPDGFETGTEAEPVSKKELIFLTEEEIIRQEISYQEISFDDLIPINLSAEKQGIRMEVISGCVKGQDLYILCSLQDLEGRYDGLNMELVQWYRDEFPRMDYSRPYSNYAENKSFWLFHTDEFTQYQAEDGTITFGIDRVNFEKDKSIDLLPFLKEYGKETDGVNAPGNARSFADGESTEGLKVLDYTNPLDVSLAETAKLTGIGWIDNQLHVQMHTGAETIQTKSGTGFSATQVHAYDPISSLSSRVVEWDDSGDWFPEWYDYALDIKPEDVEQRWLVAEVREVKGVVEDNWEIQVPVSMLLKETGEETTAQEEASAATDAYNEYELKEKFNECLWWFFRNWALGNTESVTAAFEHEWNTEQADPEESAKEIMKSGTPGGYKIHSVTGKIGDPDCKADVTVLWQEGESSYTCTRHELEFWLQKGENGGLEYAINPEGFKNGSANETFPDNPVLMREEDIIREVMAAHIEDVSYEELVPIGLSTEKQGMQVEVVSGCRKGDKAYLLLTTKDLNGEYSEYDCDPLFESELNYARLCVNRAAGKTTWLYRTDLSKALPTENNTLRTGITQFSFREDREIDLLPMLKEYGKTEEGVTPPKESTRFTLDGKPMENKLKALKYEESLDIHLNGNVFLSAIGWIDDQLHVQFQNKSWAMMEEYPDVPYDSYMIIANCHVEDKTYEEIKVDSSPMSWLNADGTSWDEYVFNCMPEDLDRMKLYATGTVFKATLEDDWIVEVPMDMLPDLNAAAEPSVQEVETTADSLTLEEKISREIEEYWPGIAKELKPVNLSCEKQGIRLEVTSALVKGNEAWAVYTLEDMTGDHGAPEEGYCVGGYEKDTEGKEPKTETYLLQRTSETGRRQIYIKHIEAKNPLRMEKDAFTVGIEQVCVSRYKQIDLIPFLKEYGKNEEGIELPELHPAFSKTAREGMKILDYTQPLDISLLENVKLTGIGWIDDQLHTQIHFTADPIRTSDGAGHAGAGVNVYNSVTNDVVWPLGWNDNGDEFPDWMESVMDVRQEDAEDLCLTAEVWENKEIVEDDWEVQIPMDMILSETDADAAVQKEEAEAAEDLARKQTVNRQIEEKWPGITKELKQVNLSCEKQGIRFEVISALVKGNKAWTVFSLQDIEGDRINEALLGYLDLYDARNVPDESVITTYCPLDFNKTEHKITYMVCNEYSDPYLLDYDDFVVGIRDLCVAQQSKHDLLPFARVFGEESNGVEAPENAHSLHEMDEGTGNGKKPKVLDYANPLNMGLDKDVCLMGIGWINDQLHVQTGSRQKNSIQVGSKSYAPAVSSVVASVTAADMVYWVSDINGIQSEYIFNIRREERDEMDVSLYITRILDVVKDTWEVRIPLEEVLAEDEVITE